MKKRIFALFLVSLLLFTFIVSSSALYVTPYFNNTQLTQTIFTITSGGLAAVSVYYYGYPGETTGATITSTIQKRTLLFFWSTVVSWEDEPSSYYYVGEHTYQLSSTGTYRAVVDYTIYGSGSADEITETIECTYN